MLGHTLKPALALESSPMKKKTALFCAAMTFFLAAFPAHAGRTAIDEDDNGEEIKFYLDGYCDFNLEDCGPDDGVVLPYSVAFSDGPPTDRIWVHGNGILTFGRAAEFLNEIEGTILNGGAPPLEAYGLNLVSGGQNVKLEDFAFLQSAKLTVRGNGSIVATWFICSLPTSPTSCPPDPGSDYSLVLRPTAKGFSGRFYGQSPGSDVGYVIDGAFTPTGDSFLMPATFSGDVSFVPEPSSWALLIAGFGMTGAALRRRRMATA
jgi:hypothetical protein